MVICLESSVLGGYLSNEVPGLVTGMLHLTGMKQPLRLELVGNFLRDIAGCRVDFHNPLPEGDLQKVESMQAFQTGFAGVMTASYRVVKVPRRRSSRSSSPFPEPQGLKNLLFFEWFNEGGQRVLIQSWHLQLRVTAPRWSLSHEEESTLLRQNRTRRKHFLLGEREQLGLADAFQSPGVADPFQPAASEDPFASQWESVERSAREQGNEKKTPEARSSALARELRRFEKLLLFNDEIRSRPAVVRLLSTVADLAAHLIHVLKQFMESEKRQWDYLVVDLEQSLPVFAAALTATEKVMGHAPDSADGKWLSTVQASLLNIELRMRELLTLLR
jgi:hypothetical protein